MNDGVLDKLRLFIIEQMCLPKDEKIGRETKLEGDLGISGDDAVDLLVAYGKLFKVDISNFKVNDYFDGEGGDPVGAILGWILVKLFPGSDTYPSKKNSLTVGHLEKGIIAGKLDDEIING